MRIYLDDVRDPPAFDLHGEPVQWDAVVRTSKEAIDLVRSGKVTFISFDHDLGLDVGTGYDIACEIEKLAEAMSVPPIDYEIHSGNPVGANNIDRAMKSAWRFWDRLA